MEIRESRLPWESYSLAAREYMGGSDYDVLIMHGAGESHQGRVEPLAKELAKTGARVVSFDFMSHGQSTGTVEELSLERRCEQALFVANHFKLKKDLTLIGFSMSGQTAVDVTAVMGDKVKNLVLFVPAAYDRRAWQVKFGPEFTRYLREPGSWKNSDAWVKIKKFKGSLLIIQAENDEVIPKGVVDLYYKSATNAEGITRIEILEAPHALGNWMSERRERAKWFADLITSFRNKKAVGNQNEAVRFRVLS